MCGSRRIDILGTALLSLTGYADRRRMVVLLADVNCKATKTGVSFTWTGAWEYDEVRRDVRLRERDARQGGDGRPP